MANEKVYSPETIRDNPFPQGQETSYSASKTGTIKDQAFPKRATRNVIGSMLNTKARKIIGSFKFTSMGAIQIGGYVSGSYGEIKISPNGIVGKNSNGVTTFTLDGTTGDLVLRGTIYATAGDIGGFTIASSYLYAGTGTSTAGLSPADVPFWAGATYANRATAPFRVDEEGNLVAETATISGAITAATIDVGGADATSFHVDINGNIWSGHANFASAPFKVSNAGALTATGAIISGAITATSGEIGGWTIEATTIESADDAIVLDPVNKKITVADGDNKVELLVDTGQGFIDFYYGASLRARLRGTTVGTGLRVVGGDLVIENNKSVLLENVAGNDWGRLGLNTSNQLVATLPSGNQFFMKNSAGDTNLFTVSENDVYSESTFRLHEISEPANPDANHARIFCKDNGAGKTQLFVRFASGASQSLALEP